MIFLYDYWDSFEKFKEGLVKINFIIHWLKVSWVIKIMKISIWKAFRIDIMEDYYDLYLKTDVLVLVYVFETFKKESTNFFELDPGNYLSTPSYIWDVIIRFTDVNSKLFSDIERYQLVESMIRGGILMIWKGYVEAKNKFLKSFDSNKRTLYILYSDANNSYGISMMELFATEILDWVNPEKFDQDYGPNDGAICWFLEVHFDILINCIICIMTIWTSITNHKRW